MAMIAITTKSSISVNAEKRGDRIRFERRAFIVVSDLTILMGWIDQAPSFVRSQLLSAAFSAFTQGREQSGSAGFQTRFPNLLCRRFPNRRRVVFARCAGFET